MIFSRILPAARDRKEVVSKPFRSRQSPNSRWFVSRGETMTSALRRFDATTAQFLKERAYDAYLARFGELQQVEALEGIRATLSGNEYWRAIRHVYCARHAGSGPDERECIRRMLADPRPGREAMMRPHERRRLASLPDPLTIYRGAVVCTGWAFPMGVSWTTDRRIAEEFAKGGRPNDNDVRMVAKGEADLADVVAYISSAGEREILIDTERVNSVEILGGQGYGPAKHS